MKAKAKAGLGSDKRWFFKIFYSSGLGGGLWTDLERSVGSNPATSNRFSREFAVLKFVFCRHTQRMEAKLDANLYYAALTSSNKLKGECG